MAGREKEQTSDSKEISESHSDEQAMKGNLSCDQAVEEKKGKEKGSKKKKESTRSGKKKSSKLNDNEEEEKDMLLSEFIQEIKNKKKKESTRSAQKKKKSLNDDEGEEAIKNSTETKGDKGLIQYLPLHGAALGGDWESAKKFFDRYPDAAKAKITDRGETVLHIAVTGSKAMKFVKELVTNYPTLLKEVDEMENNALFYAAAVGNTDVARFLVEMEKESTLAHKRGYYAGYTPLHIAARNGHKDTAEYLLSVTKDPKVFEGNSAFYLLRNLFTANLNKMAIDVLERYPNLVREQRFQSFVLQVPSIYGSGSDQLIYWKRLIYQWLPIVKNNYYSKGGDVENLNDSPKDSSATIISKMRGKVCSMFWNTIIHQVPIINHIYETKITHAKTRELVNSIFKEMVESEEKPRKFLEEPLFRAIELGIHELVQKIIVVYPPSALFRDDKNRNIFQVAVLHRQKKVFNLIYHMGLYRYFISDFNSILQSVEELPPSSQVSGAALQMQQELQWFEVVETMVRPSFQEKKERPASSKRSTRQKVESSKHSEGPTPSPRQMFTKKHADLVKEGERWMKDVAQSCSLVATLIVTITFAAAITVPGGNNSEGNPNFLRSPLFIFFAISDALAFFSSTISVLLFLGILTSRYLEEDFGKSLPWKLIFALVTLFISLALMMVAFGAALYIFLVDISKLFIIPIALLVCVPVTLFVSLQFPLLVDVIRSTCGSGLLSK